MQLTTKAQQRASKGAQTKASIVQAALGLATQIGLDGLSIGVLAEVMHMSKSGVFAHFGSREELQISVVQEYHRVFQEEVFTPALSQAKGLPRLVAMYRNWLNRSAVEIDSGCIYISGPVEFEDKPGPVRDELAHSVSVWHQAMRTAIEQAIECGHLKADTNSEQLLIKLLGLVLALHYQARFLKNEKMVELARTTFDTILSPLLTEQGTLAFKAI